MTQPNHFLAIDLGAESGRAILGALNDGKLALTEIHRFPNVPVRLPDGLRWDILRLWTDVKDALALAIRQSGTQALSIGVDTWGVDFGLLDRRGALIGNPYHYRDNRTDGMMDEAFRRMPREKIFDLTGIQFMQLNTLYQLLALVVGKSPALEIAENFLTIPDLLNYWLTGEIACEFSNATTTQCYDPRLRDWSAPLLDALNIPRRIFPRVIMPGTMLGALLPHVVDEVGAQTTVIAPACHDTGAAVAAVPARHRDFAWISSGTWSIMGAELRAPVITPASLKYNFTNEGGVGGTFRFSKNIAGLWLVQECRRTWAHTGNEFSYDALTQMAARARPFCAVIDVDDADFLKPGDMPARLAAYCARTGQKSPETPGEFVRGALEGIALKYRYVLEHLEAMIGHRLEPIHIVGGGTQNRLLNQFTADATGRVVVTGPIEATAIGNLMTQAIALGHVGSLADARALIANSFETSTFEPGNRAGWDDAYARLRRAMQPES
ncbi:MAG: rhamnulokinase family protein [Chloroflexota bacterium]